jgi:hypothetical protein
VVQHQNLTAEETASREEFRQRLGKGCLIALVPVGVVAIAAGIGMVWLILQVFGGPSGRGLADTGDLKPLPEGAEVVAEGGSCPGNGDGWHLCSWTVRIRIPGATADEAAQVAAEAYRSQGFTLVPPSTDEAWSSTETLYWDPGCLEGEDREELLCVSVEAPRVERYLEGREKELTRPLRGDEVDIVASTWTYFL